MKWSSRSGAVNGRVEVVYLRPEVRVRDLIDFKFLDYQTMEAAMAALRTDEFVPALAGGFIRSSEVVEVRTGFWHTFEDDS